MEDIKATPEPFPVVALGKKIIIRPLRPGETITEKGIILETTKETDTPKSIVVAVGTECDIRVPHEDGNNMRPLQVGDIVIVPDRVGIPVYYNGALHVMCIDLDVWGFVPNIKAFESKSNAASASTIIRPID